MYRMDLGYNEGEKKLMNKDLYYLVNTVRRPDEKTQLGAYLTHNGTKNPKCDAKDKRKHKSTK